MNREKMQKFMRKGRDKLNALWGEEGVEFRGVSFTAAFMAGDHLAPIEVGGRVEQPEGAIRIPKESIPEEPKVGEKLRIAGKEWRIARTVPRSWEIDWYCELGKVGR